MNDAAFTDPAPAAPPATPVPAPPAERTPRQRRWRPVVSLRTLLLAALFIGAALSLKHLRYEWVSVEGPVAGVDPPPVSVKFDEGTLSIVREIEGGRYRLFAAAQRWALLPKESNELGLGADGPGRGFSIYGSRDGLRYFPSGSVEWWPPGPSGKALLDRKTKARVAWIAGTDHSFSPDSTRILSRYDYDSRRSLLWDAENGARIAVLKGWPSEVRKTIYIDNLVDWCAKPETWSPDGRHLITLGPEGLLFLWEAKDGKEVAVLKWSEHIACPDEWFSEADAKRAAVTRDGVADSGKWREDTEFPEELNAFLDAARTPAARDEGAGSDLPVEKMVPRPQILFSPDGRWIFTAGPGGQAIFWDAETGRRGATLPRAMHGLRVAGFTANSRLLLAVGSDEVESVWDARKGCYRRLESAETEHWAMGLSNPNVVHVWDLQTQTQLGRLEHARPVTTAAFSDDGNRLLALCEGGGVRVWAFEPTGLRWPALAWVAGFFGVAFLWSVIRDRRSLATGPNDAVRNHGGVKGSSSQSLIGR